MHCFPLHQALMDYIYVVCLQGFGITAKSTSDARRADPTAIVVLNLADIGEYIRHEETLT